MFKPVPCIRAPEPGLKTQCDTTPALHILSHWGLIKMWPRTHTHTPVGLKKNVYNKCHVYREACFLFFLPRVSTAFTFTHMSYVMLRCWTFSCTRLHEILEVLVCCSLAQKRDRQCPPQTRTTLCLNKKNGTFPRSTRYTELQFRWGKTLDFPLLRRPFHGIWAKKYHRKNQNYYSFGHFNMSFSDVVTDTAPYRRWNLSHFWHG